jgi:hypothetical protein
VVNYYFFVINVMRKQIKLHQEQVIPFTNLVNEICEVGFLPEEQWVGDWLSEPRQFLDDKSPMDLINEENMEKVWYLLRFIETGEADAWEPMEYRDAQDKIRRGDVPSTYE